MIIATKISQLSAHSGALYALAPGRDEGTFFSAGADKVVAEWNIDSAKPNNFAIRTDSSIYGLLNLSGQLVIGTSNGSMHVIDLNQKKEIRFLKLHDKGIFHLSANHDSTLVFAASADGTLSVWNPTEWSLQIRLKLSNGKIRKTAINETGELLAAACEDGNIVILDTKNVIEITRFPAHEGSVNSLTFLPNGTLLSGGKDAHLKIWDAQNQFKLLDDIPAHNFAIYALALSPDQRCVASASRDKTIKLWNVDDFSKPLRLDRAHFQGHLHSVNNCMWISKDKLITCSDDRSAIVWEIYWEA